MTNHIEKFVEACEENLQYDYIANHYWEMSRDELKDILLEALWAIHEVGHNSLADYEEIKGSIVEELKERYLDEDEHEHEDESCERYNEFVDTERAKFYEED